MILFGSTATVLPPQGKMPAIFTRPNVEMSIALAKSAEHLFDNQD